MSRRFEPRLLLFLLAALLLAWGCAESDLPGENGEVVDAGPRVPVVEAPDGGGGEVDDDDMGPCDPVEGVGCAAQGERARKCVADALGRPVCVLRDVEAEVALEQPCEGVDSCVPGAACVEWADERGRRCTELCVLATEQGCRQGWACTRAIVEGGSFGLCEAAP